MSIKIRTLLTSVPALLLTVTALPASTTQDQPESEQGATSAAEQSTERTPAPALAGHPDTARQLMEWARQAPAYPEMQWNDGQRSDQVVSVGPDSDCDYSNLQDAIRDAADGPHFQFGVHVDYEFSERYVIEDPHEWMGSPWLIGGFPSCDVSDPAPDHTSRTVLDADGQGRVFRIDSSAGEDDLVRSVQLDRFVLKGGSETLGGGMRIFGRLGRLSVVLRNVAIEENSASFGGGIWMQTKGDSAYAGDPLQPLVLIDDDSSITQNEAGNAGGGIRCISGGNDVGGSLLWAGSGLIASNQADLGGGVALSGCSAVLRNGEPFPTFLPASGITHNTARASGGGIHAEDGSIVALSSNFDEMGGHPDNAATVLLNEAVRGGGIYATGPETYVALFRAAIMHNEANEDSSGEGGYGGGIYVAEEATVTTHTEDGQGGCQPGSTEGGIGIIGPCNRLTHNFAANDGGGAYVYNGATFRLEKGVFSGNSALGNGSAVYAANTSFFGGEPMARAIVLSTLARGNEEARRVFYAAGGGHIDARWSTFVNNRFPNGALFRAFAPDGRMARIELRSSIVWDDEASSGLITRGGSGNTVAYGDCLIGFQEEIPSGFTTIGYYSHIDPEFRDPENRDFRLSDTSPAINYCDDFSDPPERDLVDRVREHEYTGETTEPPESVPWGIYDLGAYTVLTDKIFRDRLEAD